MSSAANCHDKKEDNEVLPGAAIRAATRAGQIDDSSTTTMMDSCV